MQDLAQNVVVAISVIPASYNSAHTADWINMENHRYCTFLVTTGAVTAGTKLKVQKATAAGGSGATNVAQPFVGNVYYTNVGSAAKTSVVQTSATSSTSVHYINVTSASNGIYMATVDAATVTSRSYPFISLVAKGNSASTMLMCGNAILWGSRYQNETGHNVLA